MVLFFQSAFIKRDRRQGAGRAGRRFIHMNMTSNPGSGDALMERRRHLRCCWRKNPYSRKNVMQAVSPHGVACFHKAVEMFHLPLGYTMRA